MSCNHRVSPGTACGGTIRGLRLLLALALPATSLQAQVSQDWVVVSNVSSPPPPSAGVEGAADVTVDAFGYVYVTGATMASTSPHYTDIMTLKYAPDGTQLWAVTYDGPTSYYDGGNAVRVDAVGNVYVTGESEVELVTLKYDPNGILLWLDRYTQGASTGRRLEIAPDGAVYVMGGVKYNASDPIDNYLTIRYLPDGTRDWIRLSDNGIVTAVASFRRDDPVAMVVDSASNVYVTGISSGGIPTYDDIRTVKYAPSGQLLWNVRFAPPGTDTAVAMALSADGRLYIAGDNPTANATVGRTHLLRYDPATGQQLGVQTLGQGLVRFLATDRAGNVCLTGGTQLPAWPSQGLDWWTVLVDSTGTLRWTAVYQGNGVSGEDLATQVVADALGNFYVVGMRSAAPLTAPDEDIVVIKYDPAGQALWTAVYDYDRESVSRAVLGGIGQLFVTGTRATPNPFNGPGAEGRALTIKYSEPCSGSTLTYGSGCPGSGGFTPLYASTRCATPGNRLGLALSGGLGGSLAGLVFALGSPPANLPLPNGCALLVSPMLPVLPILALGGSGPGAGRGSTFLDLPLSSAGTVLTTQAFVLDAGAPGGFCNSNGVQVTVR